MREAEYLDAPERVCTRCGVRRPVEEFVRRSGSRGGGFKGWCKRCDSERASAYYWAKRERILGAAAAKRGRIRQPERTTCSECGEPLEGRQRLTCGSGPCRDKRLKRENPEAYAKREARKAERRRQARRRASEEPAPSPAT